MSRLGTTRIGTGGIAGTFSRAAPTAAVTSPSGTVTSSTTSVAYTYSSPVSRTQYSYRIRLYNQDRSATLFDTGTVVSTASPVSLAYVLSEASVYQVGVVVSDLFDDSAETYSTFSTDLSAASAFTDLETVGSVWEIGINGVGYMLADHPEKDKRYARRTAPLDPPRFSTGDTPFSQAVDRYTFIGWNDWSNGAGIQLNTPGENDKFFFDSEGIDPFTAGQISLLPSTSQGLATTYATAKMVVASDCLYTLTGAKQLTYQATPGGGTTVFSVSAAGTVSDLTSDGEYWYVCDGANIFRNNTAADVAAWSTENANLVEWCSDRIFIADASSGSTPNRLSSLTTAGVVEAVRATLAVGTTIRSITSGNGYVWFAADRQKRSVVYAYKLGTTDAQFVAFELPAGQVAQTVSFYQGNVMVRAAETGSTITRAIVYRCAQSDGRLTPQRLLDITDDTDNSAGDFAGDDRFIAFSWKAMATTADRSGIGVLDLSSGGYCKHLYAPADAATGDVTQILQWKGLFVFLVAGYGVCHESTTLLTSGWIKSWHTDLSSTLSKVLDEIEVVFDPLPASGTVAIEYSLSAGDSYTSAGTTASTAGTKVATYNPMVTGTTLGIKVTLGASATSPVVRAVVARVHPLGLADQIVTLPINCAGKLKGLNNTTLPVAPDGMSRARVLENLVQTRVSFQDIDWPITRTSTTWEMVDVSIDTVGVFDKNKGRRDDDVIAVVTLRRSFK